MSNPITPNNMPGAQQVSPSGQEDESLPPRDDAPDETPEDTPSGKPEDPMAELERLRAIHKEERKWERIAKQNRDKARMWEENQDKVRQWDELEAKNRTELEAAQARIAELEARDKEYSMQQLRSKVADEVGVPARYAVGNTEDEMREAAEQYKADRAREIEDELRRRGVNPAAPASTVTANGNPAKIPQLDRSALQDMSTKQIMEAYREGKLDDLRTGAKK